MPNPKHGAHRWGGRRSPLRWAPGCTPLRVDLATSRRRLIGQTTDSAGRRGPRRESEAMDEQSVEVRVVEEGGG